MLNWPVAAVVVVRGWRAMGRLMNLRGLEDDMLFV